jgi:ketopantoate reductase
MKICIYGAGAIGGYLGVQLARAGAKIAGLCENTRSVETKSPVLHDRLALTSVVPRGHLLGATASCL